MKRSLFVLILVSGLVGGATWYGLNRGTTPGRVSADVEQKIMLVDQFLATGEPTRALAVIDELRGEGARLGEKGDFLEIQALVAIRRHEATTTATTAFLEKYPDSAHKVDVKVAQLTAELTRSGIANPALRRAVEDFVAQNPRHNATSKLEIALARQDMELGDFDAARRRLEATLRSTNGDDETLQVAKALGEANLTRLMSGAFTRGEEHVVVSGDTINAIARRHRVTEELLMACNGITNPRALRVGQRLRVPDVDFSLHVDISTNTLELRNHGQFFKLYRVRTGRERGTTPTGTFRVLNKKQGPTWRPGDGRVYGPDDPNNELGTRWMAFEGDILGIHGTLHPDTVGHYASNGCVALRTDEVEELFDLITVGTSLEIIGEQDLTRHKVIPPPVVPPPMQMASR